LATIENITDEMLSFSHHTATAIDEHTIVIYGGLQVGGNSVRVLHLDRKRWSIYRETPGALWPVRRELHSATLVDDRILIYGGRDDTSCFGCAYWLSVSGRQARAMQWPIYVARH
jgi:hypothetical protein